MDTVYIYILNIPIMSLRPLLSDLDLGSYHYTLNVKIEDDELHKIIRLGVRHDMNSSLGTTPSFVKIAM